MPEEPMTAALNSEQAVQFTKGDRHADAREEFPQRGARKEIRQKSAPQRAGQQSDRAGQTGVS